MNPQPVLGQCRSHLKWIAVSKGKPNSVMLAPNWVRDFGQRQMARLDFGGVMTKRVLPRISPRECVVACVGVAIVGAACGSTAGAPAGTNGGKNAVLTA